MVTIQIDQIGSGAGAAYSAISTWEAATNDPVGDDTIYIGELQNQEHFLTGSASVTFAGTTDATRYRQLRSVAGAAYDPTTREGARITVSYNNNGSDEAKLRISEPFFRLGGAQVGFGMLGSDLQFNLALGGLKSAVHVSGTDCTLDSVFVELPYGASSAVGYLMIGFRIAVGGAAVVRNCVAAGSAVLGDEAFSAGMNLGFWLYNIGGPFLDGENQYLAFCSAIGITAPQPFAAGGGPGQGFRIQGVKASVAGCIAAECTESFDEDPQVASPEAGVAAGDSIPDPLTYPTESIVDSIFDETGLWAANAATLGYVNIATGLSADQIWVDIRSRDFRNRAGGKATQFSSFNANQVGTLTWLPQYDIYGELREQQYSMGHHQTFGALVQAAPRVVVRRVGTGQSSQSETTVEHLRAVADGGAAGFSKFERFFGSFLDDGVAVGDFFVTSGFATSAINGSWTVSAVTDQTVTVVDPVDDIVDEDGFPGILGLNSTQGTVGTATVPAFVLASGDSESGEIEFHRKDGSFLTDGVNAGQSIFAFGFGFSDNDSAVDARVLSVSAKVLLVEQPDVSMPPITASELTPNGIAGNQIGYEDLDAWELATRQNLINGSAPWGNTIQVAELVDETYTISSTFLARGAITDKARFRCIRAAPENRFRVEDKSGCAITSALTRAFHIREPYFRFGFDGTTHGAFAIIMTDATSATTEGIYIERSDAVVDGVWVDIRSGTGDKACIRDAQPSFPSQPPVNRTSYRNCITVGGNGGNGALRGISSIAGFASAYNCLAVGMLQNGSAIGIALLGGSSVVQNSAAFNCSVPFFRITPTFPVISHSATDDGAFFIGAAVGLGNINGAATTSFHNFSNEDFRLAPVGNLSDAGFSLGLSFETSFEGVGRSSPWEIGPFSGFVPLPEYPFEQTQQTHRYTRISRIERTDNVVNLFADCPSLINFRGEIYSAAGGFDYSAIEEQAGSQAADSDIKGAVSDDGVTDGDLYGDSYKNAIITTYFVDWKYPFSYGRRSRAVIDTYKWDGSRWEMSIASISRLLERKRGTLLTRTCGYKHYDPLTCRVDPTAFTFISSVADTGLAANQRSLFNTALVGHADNLFAFGTLVWLSGANAGKSSQVLTYAADSSAIKLVRKTPFPIANGDLFRVRAGCNHQYGDDGDCTSTFLNGFNFGGALWMPTSRRAFSQAGL